MKAEHDKWAPIVAALGLKEELNRMPRSRPRAEHCALRQPQHPAVVGRCRRGRKGSTSTTTALHPSEMFWRQLKFAEFDVSEMSMSSLPIATSQGSAVGRAPGVHDARFFHTGIFVRDDAGIETPADLRGKRVGVPEYQQTAALWGRGVLQHEFGVRRARSSGSWSVADKSHGGATGFKPPPGVKVHQIPGEHQHRRDAGRGELDAPLLYLTDRNLVDRSRIDLAADSVRPLFPDRAAEGRRYYAKTGIFPINHAVVVRRSIRAASLGRAQSVFGVRGRPRERRCAPAPRRWPPISKPGRWARTCARALALDPMAYWVTATRKVLETIAEYVHAQGLTDRRVMIEELFAPVSMDL